VRPVLVGEVRWSAKRSAWLAPPNPVETFCSACYLFSFPPFVLSSHATERRCKIRTFYPFHPSLRILPKCSQFDKREMPSLYSQLVGALIPCPLEDHSLKSQYLPCNVLDDLITPESISAQLPLTDRLYSYLISDPLPSLVCQGAKKVFAILVFIGEPQAIRDLIDKDNITDADLPLCRKNSESGARDYNTVVSRAGHIIHSFASWKEARIRDFLVNQWVVQAPMLSELGKEVKIDPQCPLPLIPLHKKSPELHGSLGVVVHQGRFHPAHQLVSLTVSARATSLSGCLHVCLGFTADLKRAQNA